ncbi:MAG: C2 family cysteine protease [Phycisphaerales bacterium]
MPESTSKCPDGFWNRVLRLSGPGADMFGEMEQRAMMAAGPVVYAEVVLAAPTGVAVTVAGPQSVNVRWGAAVSGATGYKVMRAPASGAFAEVGSVGSGSTLTFADTTVSPNKQYRYQVVAVNATVRSAPSATVTATTPMAAPTNLRASMLTPSVVQLQWQGQDSSATGYVISRSVAGGAWSTLVKLSGASTSSFTDSAVSKGTVYAYRIQAVSGAVTSVASAAVSVGVPVAAPTTIGVSVSATSHVISWSKGDASVASYAVQRATGSGEFVTLSTVGKTVVSYTDSAISGGATYVYRVVANGSGVPSGATAGIKVTAIIRATGTPTATRGSGNVALAWTDSNSADVSYRVLRSFDGTAFAQIGTVAGSTGKSFTDSSSDSARQCWYRVQTFQGGASAAISAAVRVDAVPVVPPAPTPTPTPTPTPSNGSVTVTTRYGNEMVVTLTGGTSSIRVSASGATLRIMSGSTTLSEVSMPGALFIYDRGGVNAIAIDSSVSIRTTVTSVGGGTTSITSSVANVSAWIDSTDSFSGSGTVHSIASLAGNVSKAAGASLANPTDSGSTRKVTSSLWGSGPAAADINQGAVGDCYFLASLAGFATSAPAMIAERAVDLGDGTYVVQFTQGSNQSYVRVSNDLPTSNGTNYRFAKPGASGSAWVPVMEKAYAYFRTGANTYASISGGWMADVYTAFGVASSSFALSGLSDAALFTMVSSALASGKAVTFGTFSSAATLVGGHAYTLTAVSRDANGAAVFTVRNPWGVSGTSAESSSGYAQLTYAQMVANFQAGVRAA